MADVLEYASNALPNIARLALQEARLHWVERRATSPDATNASARTSALMAKRQMFDPSYASVMSEVVLQLPGAAPT